MKQQVVEHEVCSRLYTMRNSNSRTANDVDISIKNFADKKYRCQCESVDHLTSCSLWSSNGVMRLMGVIKEDD